MGVGLVCCILENWDFSLGDVIGMLVLQSILGQDLWKAPDQCKICASQSFSKEIQDSETAPAL